jgi:dTDP-4-dehydrorhamnose reductase
MADKMTVIVFGSNGMLGRYISRYLELSNKFDVVRITKDTVNASTIDYNQLFGILSSYKSAVVINCIGKIPQRANNNIRDYIRVNTLFPHLLSQCSKDSNNKLIHITTDCVFMGSKGNYSERDQHDEDNIYGLSKSLGEPVNSCIIRTSIIGDELENKKSLLESIKSKCGGAFNGYTNHYWNGVTCLQLAKIIYHMITNNIMWSGVKHIFSPNIVSKYELAKIIIDAYELNITLIPAEAQYTNKTLSTIFEQFLEIPDLRQQIRELKEFSPFLLEPYNLIHDWCIALDDFQYLH